MFKSYVHVENSNKFISFEEVQIPIDKTVKPMSDGTGQFGPKDKLATFGFVSNEIRKIAGRILTIVDATYSDKEQKKAVKDLIKGVIAEAYEFTAGQLQDQEYCEKIANENCPDNLEELETVDLVEEMLK